MLNSKPKKEIIHVRLDGTDLAFISFLASKEGVSKSEIIRRLINLHRTTAEADILVDAIQGEYRITVKRFKHKQI